ncbi:nucleotidyltransferase family protein [Paucibacter sp. R3-3]|uniref:Nucleotidyltransferase family protein n=1 Tax=Roseateles agri TaxID=3098619 RepID=A0ABU5DJ62_9BURK|nr:nucleotidyltransferase family protein [Paucibacter sp. R3-3]MDY0745831.1 nucleotidyltransferase family protein [Paucibacter sp. R3-3]
MSKRRPVVVVLAAGRGMRFRGPGHKLMQQLGPNADMTADLTADTMLSRTLRHALETGLRVVVVTSAALAPAVRKLVASQDLVEMPEFDGRGRPSQVGMGHSIAAGVSATGDADGWLIVPADMPLMRPASMRAVADAIDHFPVAYAQYRGRRGHPVGFSAELYSELVDLHGDDGARRLLARYPSQPVDVDDPGVLVDIDTEDDLARLLKAAEPSDSPSDQR